VGHIVRIGEESFLKKMWLKNIKKQNYLGNQGVDKRIILKTDPRKVRCECVN
jgi:hypothetical protein